MLLLAALACLTLKLQVLFSGLVDLPGSMLALDDLQGGTLPAGQLLDTPPEQFAGDQWQQAAAELVITMQSSAVRRPTKLQVRFGLHHNSSAKVCWT